MDEGIVDPNNGLTYYPVTFEQEPSSWLNFGDGWGKTLQDIAKIGASTWAQTTLLQKNQDGVAFIEGQRLAALRAQSVGGIPLIYLLIGGGLLAFVLMND